MFFPCLKLPLAAVAGLLLLSCGQDSRNSAGPASNPRPTEYHTTSELHAGGKLPTPEVGNRFDDLSAAVREGKRLYESYNCNGCHSGGGGGMGPPLLDEQWIYGGRPEQIVATIIEGRPNGMPSFRGKIPETHIWQLAAYVRSLGTSAEDTAAANKNANQ